MAFKVYKPGQGRYARLTCGAMLGLLTAYGCKALADTLVDAGKLPEFTKKVFLGAEVTYAQVVPIAVFIAIMAVIIWGLNYPKFAEFLIETEIEMGRVAWPSRSSVIGSSMIVIVTVVIMSLLLFGMDNALLFLLQKSGLYEVRNVLQ